MRVGSRLVRRRGREGNVESARSAIVEDFPTSCYLKIKTQQREREDSSSFRGFIDNGTFRMSGRVSVGLRKIHFPALLLTKSKCLIWITNFNFAWNNPHKGKDFLDSSSASSATVRFCICDFSFGVKLVLILLRLGNN